MDVPHVLASSQVSSELRLGAPAERRPRRDRRGSPGSRCTCGSRARRPPARWPASAAARPRPVGGDGLAHRAAALRAARARLCLRRCLRLALQPTDFALTSAAGGPTSAAETVSGWRKSSSYRGTRRDSAAVRRDSIREILSPASFCAAYAATSGRRIKSASVGSKPVSGDGSRSAASSTRLGARPQTSSALSGGSGPVRSSGLLS